MTDCRTTDTSCEPIAFGNRREWERHAAWLREHLRVSLGLLPEPRRTPLHACIDSRFDGDGYTCERVHFQSLPGFYVTGNLFRPRPEGRAPRRTRYPAVLNAHGHWPDGRCYDHSPLGRIVNRCINLAKQGYVAFAYDMIGYNDACQWEHRSPVERDSLWGLSLMGLQSWNSIRALDFLAALPDVDPKRLGMTGASGGGTQTFILNAVDDRLAAAAPICMVSASFQGGCCCENAPLLRLGPVSNVEIAALLAPKPQLFGSCTGDWTTNTLAVELPAIRRLYRLYGAEKRVFGRHVDSGHNYNQALREAVYGFFAHTLQGRRSADPVPEVDSSTWPSLGKRLVWWGREAPEPLSAKQVADLWRAHVETGLAPVLRSERAVVQTLVPLLPHLVGLGPEGLPRRAEKPAGLFVETVGDTLVVGLEHGGLVPPPEGVAHFSTYNRVPAAAAAVYIASLVAAPGSGITRLKGLRGAGGISLLAAALTPQVRGIVVSGTGLDADSDASWHRHLDIPGIRQLGGLTTLRAALRARGVDLA